MGVQFGVLDVDPSADLRCGRELVGRVHLVPAGVVKVEQVRDRVEQGGPAGRVSGREHDPVGLDHERTVLRHVPADQPDPPVRRPDPRFDRDMGQQGRVHGCAGDGPLVQQIVDLRDRLGVDALVQLPLGGQERVLGRLVQSVEVPDVVGGELLQAQLGVLHRGEGRRPRDPVQGLAGFRLGAQQVGEDLRAGLARADDGHVCGAGKRGSPHPVLGGMEHLRSEQSGKFRRHRRFGPHPQDDVAGRHRPGPRRTIGMDAHLDPEQPGVRMPAQRVHPGTETRGVQAAGHPAAVVVVLLPQHVETFVEVEPEQPVVRVQIGQERPAAGRVGQGDQISEERHL